MLHHMLIAAQTIARNWRKMKCPTIAEWLCEMNEMQSRCNPGKELLYKIRYKIKQVNKSQKYGNNGKNFEPLQHLCLCGIFLVGRIWILIKREQHKANLQI